MRAQCERSANIWACGHTRDPYFVILGGHQAQLMSDLRIMIKAEGQSSNRPSAVSRPTAIIEGDLTGLINAKDPSC